MTTKNTDTPKNKALQQAKIMTLQWLLDSVEFYIRKSKAELSAKARTKTQEYRWWKYNLAVGQAVRIRELFPDCSRPPMNNPDPLNGLHELNDWVIEELKKAGTNPEQLDDKRKKIKPPSEEAIQAYQLYGVVGNQTTVAEYMNKDKKLRCSHYYPFTQSKVSRLNAQYKVWLDSAGLPDVNKKPKIKVETVGSDFIEVGKRTDSSKATGSQLNKRR